MTTPLSSDNHWIFMIADVLKAKIEWNKNWNWSSIDGSHCIQKKLTSKTGMIPYDIHFYIVWVGVMTWITTIFHKGCMLHTSIIITILLIYLHYHPYLLLQLNFSIIACNIIKLLWYVLSSEVSTSLHTPKKFPGSSPFVWLDIVNLDQ